MVKITYRVSEIRIGTASPGSASITGIKNINWGDIDPWIKLEPPVASQAIYQNLRPPGIEGRLVCLDQASMYTGLYQTAVNGSSPAINPTTSEKKTIGYFAVTLIFHDGTSATYSFTNVRIRTISLDSLSEEGTESSWTITFYADKVTKL